MTSPAEEAVHVLVVDEDVATLQELSARLTSEGHRVTVFSSSHGLPALMAGLSPDIVLIDVLMPDLNRVELRKLLQASVAQRGPKVVLHSRVPERLLRSVADTQGSAGFIQKTSSKLEFLMAFNAILDRLDRALPEVAESDPSFSGTHRIQSVPDASPEDAPHLRTGNTR